MRTLLSIGALQPSSDLSLLYIVEHSRAALGFAELIDLLHLGALVVLERREVIIVLIDISLVVLIDAETELDHAVDAASKGGRLVQGEAGGEQRGVEQQPDEVLHGLVVLVLIGTGTEGVDDRVHRVDLHGLLGGHVALHGVVLEGLGLHDALHVGRPAVLAGHQAARGGGQTLRDDDLLGLVAEDLLHELAEVLAGSLLLLELLLLVLGLLEVEALLGDGLQLLAVVLLKLLHGVLIDRINHEEHLEATLLQLLDERRCLDSSLGLTGDVVDVLLLLLHAGHVVLEGGHLLARLGGVVAHQLSDLSAVLGVLVDTELEVLAELLVELVEVLLVLGNLVEALEGLLHEVLLDHLKDLGALEHLTGNVERKVLGVDNTLDEAEVLWDEVLAAVGDEHTAHVELDVGLLLGRLEHVERSTLWHEEESLELEVTLPVVANVLVEGGVLLLSDLLRVAHPQRLLLVHELPLVGDLLHLLSLLWLLLIFLDLLDLWLVVIAILVLVLVLVIGDLLLGGLLHPREMG